MQLPVVPKVPPMLQRLFVYGTLAPGSVNEHILRDVAGTWSKGSVRGRLLQEGWGADRGYPGIVVDPTAELVSGFVLASEALTKEWERLDDFEGGEYERVVAEVELEGGQVAPAFLYQLKR